MSAKINLAAGVAGVAEAAEAAMWVKDFGLAYDGEELLRGVNLRVNAGARVAILGRSGCGKSSLLRAMVRANIAANEAPSGTCASAPTGGEMAVTGQKSSAQTAAQTASKTARKTPADIAATGEATSGEISFAAGCKVAFMQQNALLFEHLSALDNAALALLLASVPKARAREEAAAKLELLGILEHAHKRPSALSGGQAQRVALARTLASEAQILLLDEPFSALDYLSKIILQKELKALLDRTQRAMVLISHDVDEALFLADEIYAIARGTLTRLPNDKAQILDFL